MVSIQNLEFELQDLLKKKKYSEIIFEITTKTKEEERNAGLFVLLGISRMSSNKKNKSQVFEDELIKRLSHSIKFEFKALNHKKKFSSVEELIGYEGNLISKELDHSRKTICFDKEGDMLTSKKFSEVIFNTSGQFNLVIGGTYGLSNEIKLKADRLISFSNMEFAHDLFRLMLLEQLYRGHCIKTNHPYHQNEK